MSNIRLHGAEILVAAIFASPKGSYKQFCDLRNNAIYTCLIFQNEIIKVKPHISALMVLNYSYIDTSKPSSYYYKLVINCNMTCFIQFGSSLVNITECSLFGREIVNFLNFIKPISTKTLFLCSIKAQRRVLCDHNVSRMV